MLIKRIKSYRTKNRWTTLGTLVFETERERRMQLMEMEVSDGELYINPPNSLPNVLCESSQYRFQSVSSQVL